MFFLRLGDGTDFRRVFIIQRATWHVPQGQTSIAQRGAAAASHLAAPPTDDSAGSRPSSTRASSIASTTTHSSLLSATRHSKDAEGDSGTTIEVALKVIPKKKVKGNEDSVWGEMEVLKGLDHKNIV